MSNGTALISIIYAYRNREPLRIQASLSSLKSQKIQNFEVIFVDYGSSSQNASATQKIVNQYAFATYYYIGHPGLLWCKSRAINYGITHAQAQQVFIADTDVLFRADFTEILQTVQSEDSFSIFKIAYLSKDLSVSDTISLSYEKRKYTHIDQTFGIALFPKRALLEVYGLDTFFHFYGAEDSDLNERLSHAGYKQLLHDGIYMQHIWHPRFPQKSKERLTVEPRLSNIIRLNQAHFLNNSKLKLIKPLSSGVLGYTYMPVDYQILLRPTYVHIIENIAAALDHFCNFQLNYLTDQVVKLIVYQSDYYKSVKYRLKKILGKETQLYIDMKQVNDKILECILFRYRDYNYAYTIHENLRQIEFTLDLRKNSIKSHEN